MSHVLCWRDWRGDVTDWKGQRWRYRQEIKTEGEEAQTRTYKYIFKLKAVLFSSIAHEQTIHMFLPPTWPSIKYRQPLYTHTQVLK